MKLKANYHTHTVFCDGADTPEDVVLAAIGKGFTHLGFSGHMDYFALFRRATAAGGKVCRQDRDPARAGA